MNIAVNTRLLLKHRMEGIAVFTWEISRRMAEQHPEDHFYFFFDRVPDSSFTGLDNIHPVVIRPQTRHELLWKYWFDYALPSAFKKYKIDVFFSPESYLSLRSDIPTVMVTHDLCFLHYPNDYKSSHLRYLKKHGPLFHSRADHIIAVSETTKADIQKQYGIASSDITVAYNAARDEFKPIAQSKKIEVRDRLTDGRPYVLYVGSVHPRKNVGGLIRAFGMLIEKLSSDHQLVLFGRWIAGQGECERLIEESDFGDRIVLCGDGDGLVQEIVAAADCLVYPSFYEGFGIPIVEAMACGVPVVTSGSGAMKEVGGEAAIFIDPNDDQNMAEGMERALRLDDKNIDSRERAQQNLQRFSWDKSAEIIYRSIKSIDNK